MEYIFVDSDKVDKQAPGLITYVVNQVFNNFELFLFSLFFSIVFVSVTSFKLWRIENWDKFINFISSAVAIVETFFNA